jgi:hypothetical protein
MNRNEHECTAALRGTDADYATGTITIPNGQSGSIYYSIAPNFWRALKLKPYCIDNNLLVRLRFQDSANIIVSGSMTLMLYSYQYDNLFINNTYACVYTISQNSLQDLGRGTCNGFVEMRGSHYLQFTTDSTLVGGSYEIYVFGICNECLQIEKAELKTSRT